MHSFAYLVFLILSVQQALSTPGTVTVNWWTPNDLAAMVKGGDCSSGDAKPAKFTVTLLVCPYRDPWLPVVPGMNRQCKAKETHELPADQRSGAVTFNDVPQGLHLLFFKAGNLQPVDKPLRVYGGPNEVEQVEVKWLTVFGRVTKGGRPVHARLFNTAVTDPSTGRYTAAVTRFPSGDPMVIKPCDGSREYWFVPESAPAENASFDIELPSNRLEIDFVDAATSQPVKNVPVNYSAFHDERENTAYFSMFAGRSDERGRVTIEPLIAGKPVRVCARPDDYESVCSDPFTIKANETKQLRIPLTKAVTAEGRVLTPGRSRVIWHNLAGVTESVYTDKEGRFIYKRPHEPGEIVTVLSGAGFYAFVQPRIEVGQNFDIALPYARRRSFEVSLSRNSRAPVGFFTIALGDLIVPDYGFAQYLMELKQQPALQPGSTTVVSNIFETAPISVIFVPSGGAKGGNWSLHPEARSLPRRALGESNAVTFD